MSMELEDSIRNKTETSQNYHTDTSLRDDPNSIKKLSPMQKTNLKVELWNKWYCQKHKENIAALKSQL